MARNQTVEDILYQEGTVSAVDISALQVENAADVAVDDVAAIGTKSSFVLILTTHCRDVEFNLLKSDGV
jgi:hypothetical protein